MMNPDQLATAMRRANKRHAHTLAAIGKAESVKARQRHERRERNARRALIDLQRTAHAYGADC